MHCARLHVVLAVTCARATLVFGVRSHLSEVTSRVDGQLQVNAKAMRSFCASDHLELAYDRFRQ